MREILSKIFAPFEACLPDLTRVPPRRQIIGGLIISVLLHLIGLLLFLGPEWLFPTAKIEFEPPKMEEIEIQMIPPAAPAAPAALALNEEPPVFDPKGLEKSETSPERPDFQSSQDMLAGSEKAGQGIEPLPSQSGAKLPFAEFKTQPASSGKETEPAAAPESAPKPPDEPATPPEAMKDQIALYTKPPPRAEPVVKEPAPKPKMSGFQPELRKTETDGSISNRGRPGVNAIKTPLGVYQQRLGTQIQARWLYYTKKHSDMLALGTTKVRFYVTQDGRVENVQVLQNDSNQSFANICEQSIREAEVPAPPGDLEAMRSGRLELTYSFTLYDSH